MTDPTPPESNESTSEAFDEDEEAAAATAALLSGEDRDLPRFVDTYVVEGEETLEMLAKELFVPPEQELPMEHFSRVMQQLNPGVIAKGTTPTSPLSKGKRLTLPSNFDRGRDGP